MTDAAVLPASATTRRAVRAFGFGERTVVLDTNVRRVLTRVLVGQAVPTPHLTAADRDSAAAFLPSDAAEAAVWNVGLMELGALVCTVRTPDCEACPLAARCAWLRAGKPADVGLRPRDQPGPAPTGRPAGGSWRCSRESAEPVPLAVLGCAVAGGAPGDEAFGLPGSIDRGTRAPGAD